MMKTHLLTLVAGAALAVHAQAQVLINDTFASGNITNWYSAGVAGSSISAFNAGGGNEYLSINSSNVATAGNHAFRAFTGTTLAVGETMRLTVDIAQFNNMGNVNNAFGFALFNTTSSYTADQSAANIWATGSQGYRFFLASGTGSNSTLGWLNLGATNTPWAGAANTNANSTDAAGILSTNVLKFELAAISTNEVQLTVINGASTLFNAVSTSGGNPDYFTFNTLAIGYLTTSAANRSVRLDSVHLEVVPEPSTVALLALGSGALWFAVRRRLT